MFALFLQSNLKIFILLFFFHYNPMNYDKINKGAVINLLLLDLSITGALLSTVNNTKLLSESISCIDFNFEIDTSFNHKLVIIGKDE